MQVAMSLLVSSNLQRLMTVQGLWLSKRLDCIWHPPIGTERMAIRTPPDLGEVKRLPQVIRGRSYSLVTAYHLLNLFQGTSRIEVACFAAVKQFQMLHPGLELVWAPPKIVVALPFTMTHRYCLNWSKSRDRINEAISEKTQPSENTSEA
jgi:hypothetical protein